MVFVSENTQPETPSDDLTTVPLAPNHPIEIAIARLDDFSRSLTERNLVAREEIQDFLLDMRLDLMQLRGHSWPSDSVVA